MTIYNIFFPQPTVRMLTSAQTSTMMIEEENPTFGYLFESPSKSQEIRLEMWKKNHRIILGRKQPKNQPKDSDVHKIVVPNNPRLSSEHAYITIKRKNTRAHLNIIDIILGAKLPREILVMILGYVYCDFQVTIRDLGSNCGTYIPKNRGLGVEQFWLMDQLSPRQFSFGIYFLSTPGQYQMKVNDFSLINYIQRCDVISDNEDIKEKALLCKQSNAQQIKQITENLLNNYAVSVLSHEQRGYVFIQNPTKQRIMIGEHFVGEIFDGKLRVQSHLKVYTNICNEKKQNNDNKYSDAFRIKAKECLIIGEERCYLTIKA